MRDITRVIVFLGPAAFLYAAGLTPPPAKVAPVTEVLHGITVSDPYRWLEDQQAPATRAWLEAKTNSRVLIWITFRARTTAERVGRAPACREHDCPFGARRPLLL